MDEQTRRTLVSLVRASRTNPDPNVRRVSADQALQVLQAYGEVDPRLMTHRSGPGRGQAMPHPAGYQGGGPVAPNNQIHLSEIHPPIVGNYVQPLIPPSRIITVPNVPLVAPATISDPARVDFTAAGGCDNAVIVGISGCVRDDTAGVESSDNYEYASIGVQITFNDSENVITNGEAASFVPYCELFSPGSSTLYPIMREISATDTMFFRWQNFQPAVGGNSLQPSLSLHILRKDYPGTAR